jgi:large subunit ribosomal protein L22
MPPTDTDAREAVARVRHMPSSPTKVRPVLQLIAGQDVMSARDTLRLSDRGVSNDIAKVLDSAVANAEHNENIPQDELYIARAYADEGPTMKRWRPRARGRGTRIRKRTTHLTIVVARFGDEQLEQRRRADETSGRAPRRPSRRRAAPAVDHDHVHDHDDEVAEDDEAVAEKPAKKSTAKKATKKSTKKATKKADTTADEAPKKSTKKSTTKKSTTKKTTTAKKTTAKKAPAKKPTTTDKDA